MIPSVFPSLLTYAMVGTFILRLALGLSLCRLGYQLLAQKSQQTPWTKALGSTTLVAGVLLTIGLYTQVAVIVAIILALISIKFKSQRENNLNFSLLLITISLALLFLGPGIFAIDLPL